MGHHGQNPTAAHLAAEHLPDCPVCGESYDPDAGYASYVEIATGTTTILYGTCSEPCAADISIEHQENQSHE